MSDSTHQGPPAPLWRLPEPASELAARAVARAHGLGHPLVAQILMRRGLIDDALAHYLTPDLSRLFDPRELRHLPQALSVIDEAVRSGRRIVVYGDYDVDGTTGASLLESYLRHRGADVSSFIPMRHEGYGLSKSSIERIARESKPELLLTVDCGTSSRAEADLARSLGMEVVVTDHHRPTPGKETSGIVVNPHIAGDGYPNKELAGVAVGYKLVSALHGSHPTANLDLVSLGTIADVMRLDGENRALVRAGLFRLGHTHRPGLRALLGTALKEAPCTHGGKSATCFPVTAEQVAFQIGPRINAIGRMGLDPMLVVELFTTDDEARGIEIARRLDEANKERRETTNRLVDEAIAAVDGSAPVIVYQADLFKGVAGLVAGRLAAEFGKPAIVVDLEGSGSARSVDGIDLLSVLQGSFGKLIGAAGHSMAMGIHGVADVSALRTALEGYTWPDALGKELEIDAVCRIDDLGWPLIESLERLEPTGAGNPAPLFALGGVFVDAVKLLGAEGRHAKLRLRDENGSICSAIWFNCAGKVPETGARIDVAGRPTVSNFRNTSSIELQVAAVRTSTGEIAPTLGAASGASAA
jgi:single-stranded-DNA-specific exonuclease